MESAIRLIRHARILLALAVAALAVPFVALAGTTAASAGAASGSDAVPHYQHIVVITFADHSYSNILSNKDAPAFNRLTGGLRPGHPLLHHLRPRRGRDNGVPGRQLLRRQRRLAVLGPARQQADPAQPAR